MQITFKNIIPAPLEGVLDKNSQIWATEVSFEKNRRYGINAPSGKGKSTFIHLIYGLRNDFKGELKLDDKIVQKISLNEWAKIRQHKFSIVFQDLRLFMNLTAFENIELKALLNKKDNKAQIEEMAERLGIQHVLNKKAQLLSYGERQRTAIIRAMVQPFEFLLLDEPFSHLDELNIQKACQLIDEKCLENQASILMTTLGYDYALKFDEKLIL